MENSTEDLMHKDIFLNIYKALLSDGKKCSPGNNEIIEIENFNYELSPYVRFTNFKHRKLSLNYIKKEFLWYLKGDKFDTSICQHAKLWKNFVNLDGSINSNYGYYIFTSKQFDNVVDILSRDRDSRRASMVILNRNHLLSSLYSADVPCTYSISFRIRDNRLNMTIRMRSQDAIWGMSNDVPAFSFIHEMLYVELRDKFYNNLEYGSYYHSCDSFHVYQRHYEMLNEIIENSEYELIYCPKIYDVKEVEKLKKSDFKDIDKDHKFTKWLLEE